MTDTVTITRRDAHAIQSLLDHLNEWIESLVEGHSVPGKPLESDEARQAQEMENQPWP